MRSKRLVFTAAVTLLGLAILIDCSQKPSTSKLTGGAPEVRWKATSAPIGPDSDTRALWATDASQDVFAVGTNKSMSTVWLSRDGGQHWREQIVGDGVTLYALWGTENGDAVWAAGDHGLFVSQDHGEHWNAAHGSDAFFELKALWGTPDGRTIWVAGDYGIWMSSGGADWQEQRHSRTVKLDRIFAMWGTKDCSKLWAAGDKVLRSTDGGKQWSERSSGIPSFAIISGFVGDEGGTKLWAVGGNSGKGAVYFSDDGGEHWRELPTYLPQDSYLEGVWINDAGGYIWAGGWRKKNTNTLDYSGVILFSADNGTNWNVQQDGELGSFVHAVRGTLHDNKVRLWAAGLQMLTDGIVVDNYPSVSNVRLIGPNLRAELRNDGNHTRKVSLVVNGINAICKDCFEASARPAAPPQSLQLGGHQTAPLMSFPIDSAALGIHAGDRVALRVRATYDDFYVEDIPTVPLVRVYDRWKFVRDYRIAFIGAGVITSGLACLVMLLLISPLSLRNLQRKLQIYDVVSNISLPIISEPLKFLLKLTVLPWFAQHNRVLDAWVIKALPKVIDRFNNDPLTKQAGGYVPLPLWLQPRNEMVERPTVISLRPLFSETRNLVQVVGMGGCGKTTLALQLARWASQGGPEGLASQRMLPMILDEDIDPEDDERKNLFAIIRRKLHAWFEHDKVEDSFLNALLKKQRIITVVDRISERSTQTQEHIRTVHSSIDVNAVILTSRVLIQLETANVSEVYPLPLDASTLLHLMHNMLERLPRENRPFVTPDDQLKLGRRLVEFLALPDERSVTLKGRDPVDDDKASITPLLVKLFLREAIELAQNQPNRSVDELDLPRSIPQVYFQYLCSLNPHGSDIDDELEDARMLVISRVLARLALGDDLIPKEFSKTEATDSLQIGSDDTARILSRLIANGVLLRRSIAGVEMYRFVLDPVCETLGAFEHAFVSGSDSTKWKHLIDAATEKDATGFIRALNQVYSSFRKDFNWPPDVG